MSQHNTSNNRLGHSKGKAYSHQSNIVFNEFFSKPQSMKELSVLTGIDRGNICWIIREMRLSGIIQVYKRAKCSITRRMVNKYTTDPELFPFNGQMSLF